jgi:hypothetical protein
MNINGEVISQDHINLHDTSSAKCRFLYTTRILLTGHYIFFTVMAAKLQIWNYEHYSGQRDTHTQL